MTIGFAILPDSGLHNYIRGLQLRLNQKLGIRLSRQSPHITIKSPFETNDLQAHIDYLEQLAPQIDPFDIRCSGFGTFGKQVLFLRVADNPDLLALHNRILKDLDNQFGIQAHEFEGENVVFHASIAGFRESENIEDALAFLKTEHPELVFKARELGVFFHLGGGDGWIVLRRIKLRK